MAFFPAMARALHGAISAVALVCLTLGADPAAAGAGAASAAQSPLIIRNDGGGNLKDYLSRLDEVVRSGRRVEIRGRCYSSCTIFLSAPEVCVTPEARLGFHGPRYLQSQMSRERFDHWSAVLAEHYPAPVARWYMDDARFKIEGVKIVRGRNMQRLGIPLC